MHCLCGSWASCSRFLYSPSLSKSQFPSGVKCTCSTNAFHHVLMVPTTLPLYTLRLTRFCVLWLPFHILFCNHQFLLWLLAAKKFVHLSAFMLILTCTLWYAACCCCWNYYCYVSVLLCACSPGSERDMPMKTSSLMYNVASWPVTNKNSVSAAGAFTCTP